MALLAVAAAVALTAPACGLTVTEEPPSYEDLTPAEKDVVETVLAELQRFNAQVQVRTDHDISAVLDRDHIHVSFDGLIFSANLGDDLIHVSSWENLGQRKQALVAQWFEATEEQAAPVYRKFFYQFTAAVQGAKQYMYEALTPEWVYSHRSIFNVERDSIRTALAHYVAEGRQQEMWGFVTDTCAPVLVQYGATYSSKFSKQYLNDHFTEIFDPDNPTGYMYFICRWIEMGRQDATSLTTELVWLEELPL